MLISFFGRRLIQRNHNLCRIPKRNGYIVLVPEIGEDLPQRNPLLKENDLPEFTNITIEKCIAAIGRQTVEFEEKVNSLERNFETKENKNLFEDVIHPIEDAYIPLEITWGIAKTLFYGNQSAMPTKCYIKIHERSAKANGCKYNSLAFYEACKKLINDEKEHLSEEQKLVLARYLIQGKYNGLDFLSEPKKKWQYAVYLEKLQVKIAEYKSRMEFAEKRFTHTVRDYVIVKDFPERFLKIIASDPSQPHEGPWTVNLRPYVVTTFLKHCPDRSLRRKIWEEDVTQGSLYHEKIVSTSIPLEEIRQYRQLQAKMLGYKTWTELSLKTKMVGNVDNLYNAFDTLLKTAFIAQKHEIERMHQFATEQGSKTEIAQWDILYWNEQQIRNIYKYDEDVLKNFFPLPKVMSGIFQLIKNLFSIDIVEKQKVNVWHENVSFFQVFDLKTNQQEPIGYFYFDPYTKRGERMYRPSFGTTVAIRNRSKICNTVPLGSVIFDFAPPMFGKPSLLSFEDVRTLFMQFGHLLYHLLSKAEYGESGGYSSPEWDMIKVTNYFMLNWLYQPSTLQMISSHYDTNEPLSTKMINNLNTVRTHLAGYKLCKELYLSKLDIELHSTDKFWVQIMDKLWKQHFVVPQEKIDSHVCSFEEIFSGHLGGAYYCELWSEMIAADVFGAYKETSSNNDQTDRVKEIGNKYRDTFLSLNHMYGANEIFRRFRGRDLNPEAFLDNLDLKKYVQSTSEGERQ